MKKTALRLTGNLVGSFRFLFSDIIVNRNCEEKKGTNIKFLLNDVNVLLFSKNDRMFSIHKEELLSFLSFVMENLRFNR